MNTQLVNVFAIQGNKEILIANNVKANMVDTVIKPIEKRYDSIFIEVNAIEEVVKNLPFTEIGEIPLYR